MSSLLPEVLGEQCAAFVGVHVSEDPIAGTVGIFVVVEFGLGDETVLLKRLPREKT